MGLYSGEHIKGENFMSAIEGDHFRGSLYRGRGFISSFSAAHFQRSLK